MRLLSSLLSGTAIATLLAVYAAPLALAQNINGTITIGTQSVGTVAQAGTNGTINTSTQNVTVTGGSTSGNNLRIDVTDNESRVDREDDITYEVTVTNPNSTSATVTVELRLDDDVRFRDVYDGGDRSGDTIRWTNITISGNDERRLEVDVEVDGNRDDDPDDEPCDNTIRTRAEIINGDTDEDTTRIECDSGYSNNDGVDVIFDNYNNYIPGGGYDQGLTIYKQALRPQSQAPSSTALLNESILYRITVTNSTSSNAINVQVTDSLSPPGAFSIQSTGSGQRTGSNQIRFSLSSIPAGQSRTIDYTVRVIQEGVSIQNTACVSSSNVSGQQCATNIVSVVGPGTIPVTGSFGSSEARGSLRHNVSSAIAATRSSGFGGGLLAVALVTTLAGGAFVVWRRIL